MIPNLNTSETVIRMMKPGCYMASVDLKGAFYTVPIHPEHQKYLKCLLCLMVPSTNKLTYLMVFPVRLAFLRGY